MSLRRLNDYLYSVPPGHIVDTNEVETLLAECWDSLNISADTSGGMTANKLHGRMESVEWQPPLLTFQIERHGGTVLGSSRAEIQEWTVEVEAGSAGFSQSGFRQVRLRGGRVDIDPIAEEIARKIVDQDEDYRLKWCSEDEVELLTGIVFPGDSASKPTIDGRRRRLREKVRDRLLPRWSQVRGAPNRFRRSQDS